ncbi:hypothetical protein PBAL39_15064 [Pedobacter sp. BAL39]|nr:hypothetical protein PBAL39_15064 [Pedobacter sp. BAL39]
MYFIIIGALAGLLFALFDTAVGNAEVSSVNPTVHELVGNVSPTKLLFYAGIGAIAGFLLYKVKQTLFSA